MALGVNGVAPKQGIGGRARMTGDVIGFLWLEVIVILVQASLADYVIRRRRQHEECLDIIPLEFRPAGSSFLTITDCANMPFRKGRIYAERCGVGQAAFDQAAENLCENSTEARP